MFEQPFSALSVCAQVPFQTNSSAVSAFTPGPVGARDSEPGPGGQEPGSARRAEYDINTAPAAIRQCK
jgi:hypothetical protein